MSLSSDELNYIIWRYLQEVGLETSAFSLLKESPNVTRFDSDFGDSVPIGSLISLIQKGILYSHVDQLVDSNPQRFSLFDALNLEKSINKPLEFTDRFQLRTNEAEADQVEQNGSNFRENSPEFIKILSKTYSFAPSTCSNFNPSAPSVLAFGIKAGQAKIVVLSDPNQKEIVLNHSILDCDVTLVSWSPIGNLVLTALENGELRLWTADGKLRNVLYLHHSPIIVIQWSPDSNYILTTDVDNITVVWNAQSGAMVQHFDLSKDSTTNNPIPTPQIIPSTSGNSTPLNAPGSIVPLTPASQIGSSESLGIDATWIDDTKFVVPGLLGAALVFLVGDRIPQGSLIGHRKSLSVIDFNKEASLLLTASDDRTIRVWDGTTFNNFAIMTGHTQPITSATWLDKDHIISTSLDSSIRLWDIRKPEKEVFTEVLDGIPILIAKLSPSKEFIVVGTIEASTFVFKIDFTESLILKLVSEYQAEIVRETKVKDPNSDDIMEDVADDEVNDEKVENDNFITSLDWSSDSQQIVISYALSNSVVVKV